MPTITTTATAGPILAIGLGRYKSLACVYRSTEGVQFLTITTSRAGLANWINKHRPCVVLNEASLPVKA